MTRSGDESEHNTRNPARGPVLPPFQGPKPAGAPGLGLIRTDPRPAGRLTLPPFFAPIRPGGPLPGSRNQPRPVFAAPAPVIGNTALDVNAVETVSIDSLAPAVADAHVDEERDDMPPDACEAGEAAAPPDVAPEDAGATDAGWEATPPPTLFSEPPLELPNASEPVVEQPAAAETQLSADDITYLFGSDYESPPRVPHEGSAGGAQTLSLRPSEGGTSSQGVRRHTPAAPARRATPSRGSWRRVTPVLGSQAVTPISSPVIRPTPAQAPYAVPGLRYPTPVAVPAIVDIEASRTVARALETVAARVRAGELPITGQVPLGDDPWALAAGVAAALAALLGVRG